jgi:hypothetical protein
LKSLFLDSCSIPAPKIIFATYPHELEEENRKLKQLVADLSLDRHMLQEVGRKKAQSARATARAD